MTKLEFILANLQLKHAQEWNAAPDGDQWILANLLEVTDRSNVAEDSLDAIDQRLVELLADAPRPPNPKIVAALAGADLTLEVLEMLKKMTFVAETVAHLRGLERELLPFTDEARALIARIEGER